MRVVGIVGVEEAKLHPQERLLMAIQKVRDILIDEKATTVSSGACHLGGIDIIAEQVGHELGLGHLIYAPQSKDWYNGYKPRNLAIAKASDVVYCITVKKLPDDYKGMRFPLCYHCRTKNHVKSGGCWTVKEARKMGKPGHVIVLD